MTNPIIAQVSETQARKAQAVNENFEAVQAASLFGVNHVLTEGLTFAYYGGVMLLGNTLTAFANGTLSLAASDLNYIEANLAGTVSDNITGFTTGCIPLYTAETNELGIVTLIDYRSFAFHKLRYTNLTPVSSSAGSPSTESNLMTYSVPAGTLTAPGRGVRIKAWGLTSSTANVKTLKLYFGTHVILTQIMTASQASKWEIIAEVFSAPGSPAGQRFVARLSQGGSTQITDVEEGTAAQDTTAAITLKVTGDAPAASDFIQNGLSVEFIN